jgi:hypothetical protein
MNFQDTLNAYLLKHSNQIKISYRWPFSTKAFPLPYTKQSSNDYQNSLDLREFIHKKIKTKSEKSSELQTWYVKYWGGVKTNRESTFEDYLQTSSEDLIKKRGEKGIASWSKMLSVRDPSAFAIYDARVALSLNTISLKKSSKPNLFFPQLPSRNKKIVEAQAFIKKYAKSKNLNSESEFYSHYLCFLRQAVSDCGNQFDMQTAEMVLFANAEDLASHWS